LARLAHALVRREGRKPVAVLGRAVSLHRSFLDSFLSATADLDVRVASPDAALAAARRAIELAKV
jgi:hypothetical protein